MAELTAASILNKFYRLVGTFPDDQQLTEQGEDTNEVAYECLTEGVRDAQIRMIDLGWGGWRKRSSALTFQGSDSTTGGRYTTLPSDFLRAYGSVKLGRSALVEPDGTRWGVEIHDYEDDVRGNGYYIRGDQLWLARQANIPSTIYLDYHYQHPAWAVDVTIDFPARCRGLIPPCAAQVAMDENWLPGGDGMKVAISNALMNAENRVRKYVRTTKSPRKFKRPTRIASRW